MTGRRANLQPAVVRSAVASLALAAVVLAGGAAAVAAQDQTPTPDASPGAGVRAPMDPRSSGEGPGLEAEPLIVLVGVVVLGAAAAGGTLAYVRLTKDT